MRGLSRRYSQCTPTDIAGSHSIALRSQHSSSAHWFGSHLSGLASRCVALLRNEGSKSMLRRSALRTFTIARPVGPTAGLGRALCRTAFRSVPPAALRLVHALSLLPTGLAQSRSTSTAARSSDVESQLQESREMCSSAAIPASRQCAPPASRYHLWLPAAMTPPPASAQRGSRAAASAPCELCNLRMNRKILTCM
jgi:hypothetical protein